MGGRGSISARTRACLVIGASVAALAISQNAQAQAQLCPDGQPGPICTIDNEGDSGAIVGTNGNVTIINNTGTITGAPAINMGGSVVLFVNNETSGVITGTGGVAIQAAYRLNTAIDNSGTINGNVVVTDAPGPNPFTAGLITYISDGGILNGDLQLGTTGFTRANFIQRGADDGVTGTITAGQGVDIYTRSYSTSQALLLGARALPSTFEIEGFETRSADTTLTLAGVGTTINLSGTGNVINTGTINRVDTSALYPAGTNFISEAIGYYQPNTAVFRRLQIPAGQPGSFFVATYGSALNSFTNAGIVNGDVNLGTASFLNTGDINLITSSLGSTIYGAANRDFVFENQGSIEMSVTGGRPPGIAVASEFADGFEAAMRLRSALDTTETSDVTIRNSGTIVGGLNARFAAEHFVFENTGSIEGIDNPGGYVAPGLVLWAGELSNGIGPDPETHFDAATATFVNSATGSIDHGTEAYFSAFEVSFENRGFMAGSDVSPDALYVAQYLDADDTDATSFSFLNTGMFEGNVGLETETTTVSIVNSGDVTAVGYVPSPQTFPETLFGGETAFEIDNETNLDQTLSFTNSGNIINTTHAGSGVVIEVDAGEEDFDAGDPVIANATVDVVNSGTISATGGATIVTREFATWLEPGQFLAHPIAALAVDATDVSGTAQITIENQAGGLLEAGGPIHVARPDGYYPIPQEQTGQPDVLTVAVIAAGTTIDIVNAGSIVGGPGTVHNPNAVIEGLDPKDGYIAGAIQTAGQERQIDGVVTYVASIDHLTNTETGTITGSIDLGGADDRIDNDGSITGTVYLRDGSDTLSNYGTITGNLFFGTGNDTFTQGVSAIFDGVADGEDGEDQFFLDLTGGGTIDNTIYDRLVNFELFSLIGQGQVDVELGDDDDNFENSGDLEGQVDLGSGDNEFTNTGTVTGNVTSGEGDDEIANDGTVDGNVDLGDGSNQFANSGTITGDVSGGNDADNVQNEGAIEGNVDLGEGDNQFANAEGGTVNGDVSGGDDADDVDNDGEINGDVDLGSGGNQFANSGEVNGDVSSGDDNDDIENDGTINGNIFLDGSAVPPSGSLAAKRLAGISAQALGGGDDEFTNSDTLNGSVYAGGGNDVVTNSGTITGDVDLGDGDDTLVLREDWVIGGTAIGGTGTDLIDIAFDNSAAAFPLIDANMFAEFENLLVSGGTGRLVGPLNGFTFNQVTVNNATLIGAPRMTGNVAVGSGGVFGADGLVTGNISVASGGTLSPGLRPVAGASPGQLTVAGDVSLASGSSTLFEFVPSPGASDRLLIDGDLTIASGAVLNMTGSRPLTPGIAYDMIIADTITGQFTIGTWNQQQIQGFLRYLDGASEDRLQLLGTFVFQGDAPPQAELAIDYVNSLLVNGTASAALLGSISGLLDSSGFASTAAFSLLTAEPYASATQLAVESGLSLAKVSRSGLAETSGDTAGLFGFGSAYGNWRSLDANAALGTSRAKNRGYGVLGGVGFGTATASLGGFVGYAEGRQRIAALGSETQSDGIVAGLAGHFGVGGFDLNALVAYDWSEADTVRAVPGASVASTEYDLESLVLDAGASYALDLGSFTLTPGVGVTHVSARRDAASEAGSAAFALDIDRDRHSATFVDGSLAISAPLDSGVRPWAQVGVRQQVEGELVFASAGLLGSAARFVVPGAPRDDTVVTAGAGIEATVGSNVTLSASYNGEFGGGTGTNAALGLKAKF